MSNQVPKDFIGSLPSDPIFTSGFEAWYGEIPTSTILVDGKVTQRYKKPNDLAVAQTNCTDAHSKFVGLLSDEDLGEQRLEALKMAQEAVETWPGNSAMNGPVRVALLTTSIYTVAKKAAEEGRTPPTWVSVFWENLQILDDDQLLATFRWEPLETFLTSPFAVLSRWQQELVDRGIAVYKYDDQGNLVSGLVPQLAQSSVATENAALLRELKKQLSAKKDKVLADAISGRLDNHFG